MSPFLDDRELGPAIVELLKGTDLRCAVAFWGNGATAKIFPVENAPVRARIICDLAMGGTNPDELENLGAPKNNNLKHLEWLHAKVYLSSKGLIVGSANASNNGIGFLNTPGLVEAGTFHAPSSETYEAASRWFEVMWEKALIIDEDALEVARTAWERKFSPTNLPPQKRPPIPDSLLDAVRAERERFQRVGFAFTTGETDVETRNEAAKAIIERDTRRTASLLSSRDKKELLNWPVQDTFSEWPSEDIDIWPKYFVNVHLGSRGKLYYAFYERVFDIVLDEDRGMVFAKRYGKLKETLGFRTSAQVMEKADKNNAIVIFEYIDNDGHRLFPNGDDLARLLMKLAPWR